MSDSSPEHRVRVAAPSRLHLGMFSFGQPKVRQFGGAGIMLDRPGLILEASCGERLVVAGPHADRVEGFARRIAGNARLPAELPCTLTVRAAPPQHVGLGTGTQLGLATAAALLAYFRGERPPAVELAALCGRGERSAVGTHGFELGGLLIESGKRSTGGVSPLSAREELPAAWRFVLIRPRDADGLSGQAERAAFERLPPVPHDVTARLCELALLRLLPAAREGDFDDFSQALHEFGALAGECFAGCQHGPFATPRAAELVRRLRELGIRGAGQSSWGPTLFALLPDEFAAADLVAQMSRDPANADLEFTVARTNNAGAMVDIEPR